MTKRILNVDTNVGHYDNSGDDADHPTGLWLSELTHAYHVFAEAGYDQTIVSPSGGPSPLEPRSLKFPNYDKSAKAWKGDAAKMALLAATASPEQIDAAERLKELAENSAVFLGGLRAGTLSNLSYSGRLDAQRGLFESSLVTGENAEQQLTAYLTQAQQMYGGGQSNLGTIAGLGLLGAAGTKAAGMW